LIPKSANKFFAISSFDLFEKEKITCLFEAKDESKDLNFKLSTEYFCQ
jgi:hypothetical protein